MPVTRVLTWLSTYPTSASERLIRSAIEIARIHGAEVNAMLTTPRLPRSGHWVLGGTMSDMACEVEQRAKRLAEDLAASFNEVRSRASLKGAPFVLESAPHHFGGEVGQLARFYDLVVAEIRRTPESRSEIEELIFSAARPVVVLPEDHGEPGPASFGKLAIAWDGSRTAARAVRDALPLLEMARSVEIITISDDKDLDRVPSANALRDWLAGHRVPAEARDVKGLGKPTASVLKCVAREVKADALVMGAYGHSRTQEFLLGGATMGMLSSPDFPVVFSH